MVIISLIYNLSLLVSISIIANFFEDKIDYQSKKGQLFFGIIFGLTAIMGMNYPFVLEEGVIFDGRSIVISLCSFFYGTLAGFVSALVTSAYRIYLGGIGAKIGVAVAFSSFFIGWIFHDRIKSLDNIDGKILYYLGLFVHIVMLSMMLALPGQAAISFFTLVAPNVIIFYPLATVLIGKIFHNNRKKKEFLTYYKEREETISAAFDNIDDAIILVDNLGKAKRLNKAARDLLSLSDIQTSKVYFAELFDLYDINKQISKRKELEAVFIEGKKFHSFDALFLQKKNGSFIPVATSAVPIFLNEKIIAGAAFVFKDLSESFQKQKEILELKERFLTVFKSSPLPISISDILTEKIIDVNEAFLNFFGYTKEEVIDHTAEELNLWENINERAALLNRLAISDRYIKQSAVLLKKNKERVFVEIYADFITIQDKKYLISFVVDTTEQLLKNEEIKKISAQLKLVTENIPYPIFLCDSNFNIIYANDSAYKFFNKKDFSNISFYSLLPDEHKEKIISKTRESSKKEANLANSWTYENDVKFTRSDGSASWIEINFSYAIGENSYPNYLFLLKDITERKILFQELEESNERYKNIFENEKIPMLILNPETLVIENANSPASLLLNIQEYKLGSLKLTDIFVDSIYLSAFDRQNLDKLSDNSFVFKFYVNDKEKYIEIFASKIKIKNENKILFILYDITEKKKYEEEAKLFNYVIEQASLSILITDRLGKILYVNKYLRDHTGYSSNELIGQTPRIFKSNFHEQEFYRNLWETILSGRVWKGEILNRNKFGHLFWEQTTITPILDSKGDIKYFAAIKEDISEKKDLINQLIKAREEAEKSDKLKTEFLEQISHEIRTPLNVILNFNSLIKESLSSDNSEYASYFESVENAGRRLIRAVELILDAAELKKGVYKPSFRKVDLKKEILDQLAFEASIALTKKKIDLKYYSELPKVFVYADQYSLFKIFENIIDNAVKFTFKGEVAIIIKKLFEEKLAVEIKDTGIGMSEEFKKRIFEPFIQEERGYNRTFEGNGLGLYIAKKYSEINNCQIFFESEKGKGTKFTIVFDKYFQN